MSNFIDECQIYVKGGDGGDGCISFRREAHTPKGGPDGGDGGNGGNVWICADSRVSSLIKLTQMPHQRAEDGVRGKGKNKHGHTGKDCQITVPAGTQIFNGEFEKLADLTSIGDCYLAVAGGEGGKGSARFLSNRRRAPSFAETGELGKEHTVRLELKLLADVALIGFPNAGKSTLISRISAAKPKIADYPFTTLEPNLGVVALEEMDYTVADIPGLIEGASEGKGLGHKFLRHIERAQILTILLDLSSPQPIKEQLKILLNELESYNANLLNRPRILVGSKLDMSEKEEVADMEILDISVSSIVGTGIDKLKRLMANVLTEEREKIERESAILNEPVIHRPVGEGPEIHVEKIDNKSWRLFGRAVERAVAIYELKDPEAMLYIQERLTNMGVDKVLSKAGATDGDVVNVAGLEFEYYEDAQMNLVDEE